MIKKNKSKGFTIVELMIATSIFGVILIVAASGVIAVGRMYYKGITSSRTQEVARSVIETVSRTIQFTGQPMSTGGSFPGTQSICFGRDRYTYTIDEKIVDPPPDVIGLKHDIRTDLDVCAPLEPDDSAGTELLPGGTRLLDFQITPTDSSNLTYRINVKVAYGDNDLLTHYPPNADDAASPTASSATGLCRGGIAGSHFCSVSELETVVSKRVE